MCSSRMFLGIIQSQKVPHFIVPFVFLMGNTMHFANICQIHLHVLKGRIQGHNLTYITYQWLLLPSLTARKALVTQSCPTLATPWTVAAKLLCPWNSPARVLDWVAIPPPGDLPHPGIEPGLLLCRPTVHHLSHC